MCGFCPLLSSQVLGTVEKVNLSKGRVFVRYDDGDCGWADYPDEGFEIVRNEPKGITNARIDLTDVQAHIPMMFRTSLGAVVR